MKKIIKRIARLRRQKSALFGWYRRYRQGKYTRKTRLMAALHAMIWALDTK